MKVTLTNYEIENFLNVIGHQESFRNNVGIKIPFNLDWALRVNIKKLTDRYSVINDARNDLNKSFLESDKVEENGVDATSDEAPLLSEIERVRALYSECIKRYQDNAHDLVLVENNIRNRLQNISNLINECEDNIQSGIYIDTRELLYKIDEELDVLAEYLRFMPQLINYANTVYHSLNEVIEKTNIMHADYPIKHLKPFFFPLSNNQYIGLF